MQPLRPPPPVLDGKPAPITALGIDETRRGKAKYETFPDTGKRPGGDIQAAWIAN